MTVMQFLPLTLPRWLLQAWTFSACMALIAAVTAAVFGRQVAEPTVQQQQQQQTAGHKRSATGGGWDTEAEAPRECFWGCPMWGCAGKCVVLERRWCALYRSR